MKYILILFTLPCFAQCADVDVIVLIDYSGSTASHTEEIAQVVSEFESLGNNEIHIGITVFNETGATLRGLNDNQETQLPEALGGTDISSGLLEAQYQLSKGRLHAQKIIILISDGDPNSHNRDNDVFIAYQLKMESIIIYSIFIPTENTWNCRNHMIQMAFSRWMFLEVADYQELINEVKNMTLCI